MADQSLRPDDGRACFCFFFGKSRFRYINGHHKQYILVDTNTSPDTQHTCPNTQNTNFRVHIAIYTHIHSHILPYIAIYRPLTLISWGWVLYFSMGCLYIFWFAGSGFGGSGFSLYFLWAVYWPFKALDRAGLSGGLYGPHPEAATPDHLKLAPGGVRIRAPYRPVPKTRWRAGLFLFFHWKIKILLHKWTP